MTGSVGIAELPGEVIPDDEIKLPTVALGPDTDLNYATAVEVTERISQALDVTEGLILHAYVGRAWKVLGYDSWDSWVDEQFGTRSLLPVPREDRASTVIALRQAALSNRMIARILGVCERTVRRQLRAVGSDQADQASRDDASTAANAAVELPATIVGSNGKNYRATARGSSKPHADPDPSTVQQPPDQVCDWCEEHHATQDCPFDKLALHGQAGNGAEPPGHASTPSEPANPRGQQRDHNQPCVEDNGQLTAAVETSVRTVETIVVNGVLELPHHVRAIDESVRAWSESRVVEAHLDRQVVSDLSTIRGHLARMLSTDLPTVIGVLDSAIAKMGAG